MLLGQSIRAARKQKGMTQGELAELCGVSTSAVSAWERGAATPRRDMLEQISGLLKIPTTGYTQPSPPENLDMTWDETDLLNNYWACSPETKTAILTMAREGALKAAGNEREV